MSARKVIYTAIFGDYDDLKEPAIITEGWDYICFTDRDIKSKNWKIVKVETDNPKIDCRRLWIYPYEQLQSYDLSISIGGQIQIMCDLNEFVNKYGSDFTVLRHPTRDCIYSELMHIGLLNKDSWGSVLKQAEYLKSIKFPERNGLLATGLMIRNMNNNGIKAFCGKWLKVFETSYTFRDQVSLAITIHMTLFNRFNIIDFNVLHNEFELNKHKQHG